MQKQWKQQQTILLGSKISADGDYSHEIKRHLLVKRKAMTNLDSILKSRDINLPTEVHIVQAMVFSIVMYGCESWTIKKVECWRIDALVHPTLSYLIIINYQVFPRGAHHKWKDTHWEIPSDSGYFPGPHYLWKRPNPLLHSTEYGSHSVLTFLMSKAL